MDNTTAPTTYGTETRTTYTPLATIVGAVETAPAGNLVLRIGKELEGGGWEQVEHLVLTPREWDQLKAHADRVLWSHEHA